MDIKQVAAELRGEEGSKVTLSLLRNGQEVSATVTRAMYTATRVEYAMLENSVGYISVSEFTGDVVEAYNNALADLQNQGMKGLIVDLRDNPGGYYDAVCTMVDQLLPEGPIVSTKDRHNRESVKKSDANALGIPLVVLVNGNSASASEIFAGAVQDYGVGSLVGTKTFGKGLVQIDIPFKSDGAALKYTYAKYYRCV